MYYRREQKSAQQEENPLNEAVLEIKRVSKKTKGGNSLGFTALVGVGDSHGGMGIGLGKAKDVRTAIDKGNKKARLKMVTFPLIGDTIPHGMVVQDGAVHLIIKPAPSGSGVMAGGVLKQLLELGGIKDISIKNVGTRNKFSVANSVLKVLHEMKPMVRETQK